MTVSNSITTINMPVLKRNTSGEAVRFLQQILICYGYMTSDYFDSKFNQVTEDAVKAFQYSRGLNVDGIVGNNTWRALGDFCSIRFN
ncbi:MAG TPA: peptidoglycan-binding domain-containing protein [Leptolyngbyaceae cyanobacterium]